VVAAEADLAVDPFSHADLTPRARVPSLVWWHDGPIRKAEAGAALSYVTNQVRGADKGFLNLLTAQRIGVTVAFGDILYLHPNRITVTEGATGALRTVGVKSSF